MDKNLEERAFQSALYIERKIANRKTNDRYTWLRFVWIMSVLVSTMGLYVLTGGMDRFYASALVDANEGELFPFLLSIGEMIATVVLPYLLIFVPLLYKIDKMSETYYNRILGNEKEFPFHKILRNRNGI